MLRTWPDDELRALPLEALDERYRRYRLSVPEAERAMAGSLRRYGQMSPVVVCLREERVVLVDGFKRLTAARSLRGRGTLLARRVELDERSAKAALYALNCVGRQPQEVEEAWIVQALVREDGLSQVETAELLGHHKSWVCRRLALLEKLCHEAREDLRLGLLSQTMGRQLVRLPAGNQTEALAAARRESLTAEELRGVVDLLLASARAGKDGLRTGEAPPGFAAGRAAERPLVGPAAECGRQPGQPPVGTVIGSVGSDGELVAPSGPRRIGLV